MTIAVGIIGVGVMGADHARTLVNHVPGARLRAVTDADGARARQVAAETGAETVAPDPMAVINDRSVDAVLIASPDQTHRDLTLTCLAAGKPVLCEKPLAPTARECLEVLAAEVKGGRRLVQVGYMRHFDPAYMEMKAKLLSGELGRAVMLHNFHRNVSAPTWFDAKMAISNSAVHEIDISRWLLDTELTSVQVFKPKIAGMAENGAPVFLVFETAKGQIVNVEMFNNAAYGYDVRGELVCEKGTISLRSPIHSEVNTGLASTTFYPADWRPRFADAYRLQMQAWIKSLSDGKPVGASAWDGYVTSAVGEAGHQSLAEGRSVRIALVPKPGLYD
ncbi:MAG: Gfo/Idh/MocA family oxidoreductase [Rhizobiales bacterium]|nr:Gfo/Idh/MocA family oxidoreductase [Hyphomicrobiales bacterium]MBI3673871.1 Gfo/Idh/MocA family oxidoreductase [Hyphomicrobiales bacterium]